MLEVSVTSPEKHGTSGVNAYVDYKISTRTDQAARFAQLEFFVRRRFRDFRWLREMLCVAFPAAIVPPLPQGDTLLSGSFDAEFIQRRQAGLELFLQRVARHPTPSTTQALQTFLEAKMWELQTAKNASSATAAS
eukprot:143611-Prymnesium_polylepis.1